jgi:hypothetical protein
MRVRILPVAPNSCYIKLSGEYIKARNEGVLNRRNNSGVGIILRKYGGCGKVVNPSGCDPEERRFDSDQSPHEALAERWQRIKVVP